MSPDRILVEPHKEFGKFAVEKILIAGNRGPCGGVNMALAAAYQVLEIVDGREPVYSLWDIVHNTPIMDELRLKGLVSVNNNLDLIPDGSIVFLPAHGGSPKLHEMAQANDWQMIDVTCQLVERVHNLAKKAQREGKHVIYIGINGHPETIGVLGELEESSWSLVESKQDVFRLDLPGTVRKIVYSQTTLSPKTVEEIEEDLKGVFRGTIYDPVYSEQYPELEVPDRLGICYATYNRQEAVLEMIPKVDMLVVVGSKHSHNSRELQLTGEINGRPSYLVDNPSDLKRDWFHYRRRIGITSGASVLDRFMEPVVSWIKERSPRAQVLYEDQVIPEKDMTFKLPETEIEALKAR